jgi:hypothetical protein
MPFTLAHPAAVVPLAKAHPKGLVLSALVVGSMAPDFEYFLRLALVMTWSHTFIGIFTFCLPISLIVLWVYHRLQKQALAALLPERLYRRVSFAFGEFTFLPLQRFGRICLSILLGGATHLIWDGFTHDSTLLSLTVPLWDGFELQLNKILQDLSTALGLLLLAYWGWKAVAAHAADPGPEQVPPATSHKRSVLIGLLLVSLLLVVLFTLIKQPGLRFESPRDVVRHLAVVSIPAVYIAVTGYGGIYHFQQGLLRKSCSSRIM